MRGWTGSTANNIISPAIAAANPVGGQPPVGAGVNGMDAQGGTARNSQDAGPISERSGSGSGPGETETSPSLNADCPTTALAGATCGDTHGIGTCSCGCKTCPHPGDAWPIFGNQPDEERRATTQLVPTLAMGRVALYSTGSEVQVARCTPTTIVFAQFHNNNEEGNPYYSVTAIPLNAPNAVVATPDAVWDFECPGMVIGLTLTPTFGVAVSQTTDLGSGDS